MVEVHDRLPSADAGPCRALALAVRQAMEGEQVAVLGEDDVLLVGVSAELAELAKIRGVADRVHARAAR
jgi:hypothetical protein